VREIAHRLPFAAALLVASAAAWAGPPFVTDDPEPVDFRRWEVNYAISKSWRRGEASTAIPSVDINYGVVPDVQLHVQPRYSIERVGQAAHSGFDDTEVGVKYRFFHRELNDSATMIGVYPIYLSPTGDTKLGPNRRNGQLLLPLWIQLDRDKWTFYGGPAYRINPGTDNRNTWFLGGTALYRMTASLQIGAEMYYQTPDAVDARSATGFNVGGIYTLSRSYKLLVSAGKGLTNVATTNRASAYLALQALY
jgi:hypothetical protein